MRSRLYFKNVIFFSIPSMLNAEVNRIPKPLNATRKEVALETIFSLISPSSVMSQISRSIHIYGTFVVENEKKIFQFGFFRKSPDSYS